MEKLTHLIALVCCVLQLLSCGNNTDNTPTISLNELTQKNNLSYHADQLFTGTAISYHKNKTKFIQQEYKEGIQEGKWTVWYPTGNLQKEGFKSQKKADGLYQEWYPNKQLKYVKTYHLGSKEGKWKSWYENGQQWTERDFLNNQLNGKILVWDQEGTLTKEDFYKNGQLIKSN